MTWQRFTGSTDEWNMIVERLGATTPFQLSAWGTFRESFGWKLIRLITHDGQGAAQLLVRRIGFVQVVWGAGAPLGVVTPTSLRDLVSDTKRLLDARVLYLRVADHAPRESARTSFFRAAGWSPTKQTIGSAGTLTRSLDADTAPLSDLYSSNWSRNLRRGRQRNVTAQQWYRPDAELIAALHRDVEKVKQPYHAEWRADSAAIERLLTCFGKQLVVVQAIAPDGVVHALRAAVIIGQNAYDFLAATSSEGRKLYASNVALDALLGLLATRGVQRYDFGGIDPDNNKGVFDFKHGAGGAEVVYSGEYETASPRFLKGLLAKLVASRTR